MEGCVVDSVRGIYTGAEVQRFARSTGWKGQVDLNPHSEYYFNVSIEAEDWLNANIAPPGHTFTWIGGDFMLVVRDGVDPDNIFWN